MPPSKVPGHFAYELEAKAAEMPDFPIVTFDNGDFEDEVLTYADIVSKGRKLARELALAGLAKGDVFALLMQNHPEFVVSLYATSALGVVLLPIDPRTKGDRLAYVLNDSGAKALICTSRFLPYVEEVMDRVTGLKILGVSVKEGMEPGNAAAYPDLSAILEGLEAGEPESRNDDVNVPLEIIYTSGTTGDPKGVVVKGNRLASFSQLAQFVFQYRPDDRLYTGLSLTHGNAQAVTLVPSLILNIPCVISTKFTKSRIWEVCRKHGCTTFSLLGGMMMGIYGEPPRPDDADNPVRLVLSAGTPAAAWEAFEKRFDLLIHEWYGAVEGGFAHKPPGVGPVGSFGKPLEGLMEMKIVREDGTDASPGETGEIIFRVAGQKIEVEYLGKKEASEEKTRGGWLRTGDMGHMDENGWFFFDYRAGGGLRRSGDFIQPGHVEAAVAEHPDVSDVCVYGIPAASGAPGESDLVAAVVAHNGKTIDPAGLLSHLKGRLEGNSIPSFIQVVDAIPKSASEKNLDRLLKGEFRKEAPNVFALAG